ncbi:MAG: hypothetical protein AABZ57_01035 [Candidatus Margulisiibacteriota bacterium]
MICPLCGKEVKDDQLACAGCPMNSGCNLLKCPNCGFEFPKESRIVKYFTELFGKRRKK